MRRSPGSRSYVLDIAAQIAHGAFRFFVMGERGANSGDLEAMAATLAYSRRT